MKTLDIFINTDDDCAVFYRGITYCYYAANLSISKEFSTNEDAVKFLMSEITVANGKICLSLKAWLFDACQSILNNESVESLGGNQDCRISFMDFS
jgi:hypothetical protein